MSFSELFPFKGRNPSGETAVNLLTQDGSVYVMDNHRMALWCWLRHLSPGDRCQLLHLDAHTDLSLSGIESFIDVKEMELGDYTSLKSISWDNYLSFFLRHYSEALEKAHFYTHGLKEPDAIFKNQIRVAQVPMLMRNLQKIAESRIGPWIINIDLDFFFQSGFERSLHIFSKDYILEIAKLIRDLRKLGVVKVVTIALSPECCMGNGSLDSGWENSLNLCQDILEVLGLEFPVQHYGKVI